MAPQRNTLKIAVAEEAVVVRVGLLETLRRIFDSSATLLEIARPADFNTRVASFLPDVIIASPAFGGTFNVTNVKADASLGVGQCAFLALLSSVSTVEVLRPFDAVISIIDSEETIRSAIMSLRQSVAVPKDETLDEGGQLSAREIDVVRGVVRGLANKEIADALSISVFTVITHRRNIARKLNIHSSTALAIYAISNNLVAMDELK